MRSPMRNKIQKIKYVYHLCSERHKQGHLSALRQILEIAWLQATRGIGYAKYHYANMWHKNATWDYKTSFLSQQNFVKKIHKINKRKFHGVTQYKPLEKAFLKLFNIPCADYMGILNKQLGTASKGENLQTKADLENLLKQNIDEKICFKLIEGDGGKGFRAYKIIQKNQQIFVRHLSSEKELSLDQLFHTLQEESPEGWLLEKYIVQHPTLKALNPSSINTVRLHVFQDKAGTVSVLNSLLRIGRQSSLTDNVSGGGMVSRIDQDTGILFQACKWTPELVNMPSHPDNGTQIEGITLPFWQEIKDLGKKTLLLLPQTRFVGLDIAITPEGPIIVEINVQSDSDLISFTQIQTAKVFNS